MFIVQYFVLQFSHCAITSFCPNCCVVLVTWVDYLIILRKSPSPVIEFVHFETENFIFIIVGVHIINLKKTWEKLLLAARIIVSIENPADVCVISARPYGQVNVAVCLLPLIITSISHTLY